MSYSNVQQKPQTSQFLRGLSAYKAYLLPYTKSRCLHIYAIAFIIYGNRCFACISTQHHHFYMYREIYKIQDATVHIVVYGHR